MNGKKWRKVDVLFKNSCRAVWPNSQLIPTTSVYKIPCLTTSLLLSFIQQQQFLTNFSTDSQNHFIKTSQQNQQQNQLIKPLTKPMNYSSYCQLPTNSWLGAYHSLPHVESLVHKAGIQETWLGYEYRAPN